MGETPDEIRQEVEQVRSRLGQDLNRLEYRVKRTFDWRSQFDRQNHFHLVEIRLEFGCKFAVFIFCLFGITDVSTKRLVIEFG